MIAERPPSVLTRPTGLRTRDFDRVYRRPTRRKRSARFVAVARRNQLGRVRWGISVKSRLGPAVVRNRIKRRIREILRRRAQPLSAGWDLVIQPLRSEVATADFATLSHELEALLRATLQGGEGE